MGLAHRRPAAALATAALATPTPLALAGVLVQARGVVVEWLPVGHVTVMVVPLSLDLHLEELFDALMDGRVHGRLAALLGLLPTYVLVVHDQVPVAIAAIVVD